MERTIPQYRECERARITSLASGATATATPAKRRTANAVSIWNRSGQDIVVFYENDKQTLPANPAWTSIGQHFVALPGLNDYSFQAISTTKLHIYNAGAGSFDSKGVEILFWYE